jgi:regulator of nucleoside diphosphate kinase
MNRIIMNKLDFARIMKCIQEAKSRKSINAAEAETLLAELRSARIVEPYEIPDNIVTMNSVVKIKFLKTGKEIKFRIVYPDQANIKENRISIFSPVATALIGYKVSDEIDWVVPSGLTRIRIEEIIYQPEAEGNYDL